MHTQNANEQYLRNSILSASPAKLRYLLIERAIMLVKGIVEDRNRNAELLVSERTITLRDILVELLSGIKKSDSELAHTVADLYVFLLKELTTAEQTPGVERIISIGRVLEIERETWSQVCAQQAKESSGNPAVAAPKFAGGPSAGVTSLNLNA